MEMKRNEKPVTLQDLFNHKLGNRSVCHLNEQAIAIIVMVKIKNKMSMFNIK